MINEEEKDKYLWEEFCKYFLSLSGMEIRMVCLC